MHAIDSVFLKDYFGTAEMRQVFSDENLVQKWLDVEAALARSEARLGIIPPAAADEICRKALFLNMNTESIKFGIDQTGHPLVPVIRELEKVCDGNAGEYIHWGATTQDIMDTGVVLQLLDAYHLIYNGLEEIIEILIHLAQKYKRTPMAGRTHGQHALPITFGYKVAVWIAELRRSIQRLEECQKRVFVGNFAGAVGTLASLGSQGLQVQRELMKELGLAVPEIAWHTSRDRFAEFISILSILSASLAKIANEIIILQRTEISELEAPFAPGNVGSSTMPHKRNPMVCEGIVSLSKLIRSNVLLAHEGMIMKHERDMRPWIAEWAYIPETCILVGGVIHLSKVVLTDLTVKPENMMKNLFLTDGLILSEAVMLSLAKKIGRQTAHQVVYELTMKSFEENIPFEDILLENEMVRSSLSVDEIKLLLEPTSYIGLAEEFVDRITNKGN